MTKMLHPFLVQLVMILLKIVCLLIAIAYYTIAERKIMAAIQRRRGPNVVGFWGLLQPLADGLKLVAKEMVIPSHSNSRIFVLAPLCVLTLSLLSWSILPFGCFDYTEYAANSNIVETLYGGNTGSRPKMSNGNEDTSKSASQGVWFNISSFMNRYHTQFTYVGVSIAFGPGGWGFYKYFQGRYWPKSGAVPPTPSSSPKTNNLFDLTELSSIFVDCFLTITILALWAIIAYIVLSRLWKLWLKPRLQSLLQWITICPIRSRVVVICTLVFVFLIMLYDVFFSGSVEYVSGGEPRQNGLIMSKMYRNSQQYKDATANMEPILEFLRNGEGLKPDEARRGAEMHHREMILAGIEKYGTRVVITSAIALGAAAISGAAIAIKVTRPPKGDSLFNMLTEANDISDVRYGLLVILALSSLAVYGLIIAGWASSSKYSFLGALRSAAQMISYEVSISLIIIPVIFMAGSLNFTEIVMAQTETIAFILPLLPLSIIFFISMIAETNRTPFDLPEAEAELVAGYNVEYSSIIFAMFFLAEYGNMILMSIIKSELFLGGWAGATRLPAATVVALKALIFCFAFVLVRATFPRYRYDQLMDIGWKIFLPVSTGLLILVIGVIMGYNALPVVMELNCISYSEPHLNQL